MSTIPEIKARLLEPGTPFALVKGATALALVKDRPLTLPAAYVLSPKEVSGANERGTGNVLQRSERDIMVVIVCQELSDFEGDATSDTLETFKSYVRGQVIGFVPTDMNEPITHVAGEVVEAIGGTVWFEDTYSAPIYLKETN